MKKMHIGRNQHGRRCWTNLGAEKAVQDMMDTEVDLGMTTTSFLTDTTSIPTRRHHHRRITEETTTTTTNNNRITTKTISISVLSSMSLDRWNTM